MLIEYMGTGRMGIGKRRFESREGYAYPVIDVPDMNAKRLISSNFLFREAVKGDTTEVKRTLAPEIKEVRKAGRPRKSQG